MTLLKKNPFLLSDLFNDDWFISKWPEGRTLPPVNIFDTDKEYEIDFAVPGYHKDDFHVEVENGVLKVSADTSKNVETRGKNFTKREFTTHAFSRAFSLPQNVIEENVTADYEEGVLKIHLRKSLENQTTPKKIEVM